MAVSIRMPRLLDAQCRERTRLAPLSAALHRKLLDLSEAELRLAPDAPPIAPRALIEMYDVQGSAGIFRVSATDESADGTRILRLTHTLSTLADSTTAPLSVTGTVRQALSQLLARQIVPLWSLGDVDTPDSMTVLLATDYTDLLTALRQLLSLLPEGYALAFDQSVLPWVLHLRALSDDVACEGRLSRNVHDVRYVQDTSRLCTRVYPFGVTAEDQPLSLMPLLGTDHLDSAAQSEWGIISHTLRSEHIYDTATLRDVAQRYLAVHAVPDVTVTVRAADLSRATGEALDAFRLGTMCRLCVSTLKRCLTMRIVSIDDDDVYGAPGCMTLTLTNRLHPVSGSAEIDLLLRQVTADKLLGGTVATVEDKNRAHGSVPSPVVHYFTVEDWPAVLDVQVSFTPDSGVSISDLRVDDVYPPDDTWRSGHFSAMPYLRRDAQGSIAQGEHKLILHPTNGVYGESCGVNSVVTLTVIENPNA